MLQTLGTPWLDLPPLGRGHDKVTTWCDSAATGVSLSYSSLAAALEGLAPAPASAQDQVSAAWCLRPGPMGQDTQQGHLSLHPHRHPRPGCRLGFPRWCFQAGRQALEARAGRDVTRAEEGCGRRQASPGHKDTWQILSGVSCCLLWDLHTPQSVRCWAGSGLCLSAPCLPVWEEKSLCNCPPAPPRGIGGHPPLRPACRLHTPGRDPCCTHCKKCTFGGRGWGRRSGETQSSPRKGVVWSVHPPNPRRGGLPPPHLAGGGGR